MCQPVSQGTEGVGILHLAHRIISPFTIYQMGPEKAFRILPELRFRALQEIAHSVSSL